MKAAAHIPSKTTMALSLGLLQASVDAQLLLAFVHPCPPATLVYGA